MKKSFFGLRASILTQLIFLIVAAMLLVNVVLLNLYEKDLIKAKGHEGEMVLLNVEQSLNYLHNNGSIEISNLRKNDFFSSFARRLLNASHYSTMVIIGADGSAIFKTGLSKDTIRYSLTLARDAISSMGPKIELRGTAWGVFWQRKSHIFISSILRINGRVAGGIAVGASLDSVYRTLRKSEKLVILYVIIDTIILALVGIYLLSRIVVKPVHRLLRMTEGYKDGEFMASSGDGSENEIGNLSRSLASMLKRLDENKKQLKEHILSLEKANKDLKIAQNEIIMSEKLASVGRLVAGIAHEIGNPIGIILGYLDLIKKGGLSRDEEEDFIDRVESEITRVNTIIRQLLDFSRATVEKRENCTVHGLIKDTLQMLQPQSMMKDFNIILKLDAKNYTVLADPNQLQQVFLNIIMNSVDALREKSHHKDELKIEIETLNKDNLIQIRFIDNGPGISSDELNHIFDPFFTTKEPGRGTGLGLSVSYRIIEGLGGQIRAESTSGEGMLILIELPFIQMAKEDDMEIS